MTGYQSVLQPLGFLLVATLMEVSGDALVRVGIYQHVGLIRAACLLGGALLLFGYGTFLNLAPLDFGRVVGLYIATLFVVWQCVNFFAFGARPPFATLAGGALIVGGGLLMTFWQTD